MYNNIGGKIKMLAKILAVVGVVISLLGGIGAIIFGIYSQDSTIVLIMIISGVAFALIGALFAWIGSWLLYGYGEIIDKLTHMEKFMKGGYEYKP